MASSSTLEAAKEAKLARLARVQERLDVVKEAVIFVLTGANVRKFNNSRSSFKKSGTQKPHSVFMRIAQNEEWILVLTWQEKHGVVVSVSDDLFDAEFQGSRWAEPGPEPALVSPWALTPALTLPLAQYRKPRPTLNTAGSKLTWLRRRSASQSSWM